MNKTVTLTVDSDLDNQFRQRVSEVYGDSKGALGKAIAEAIKLWLSLGSDYEKKAVDLMKKGYSLGGGPYYSKRSELYERTR